MYMFKYCCDCCNETWYRVPVENTKEFVTKIYDGCKFTSVVCPNCQAEDLYLDSVVQVTTIEEVLP